MHPPWSRQGSLSQAGQMLQEKSVCVCVCWRMGPLPQQGALGSGAGGQRRTRVARAAGEGSRGGQQTRRDYLTVRETGMRSQPGQSTDRHPSDYLTIRAPVRTETQAQPGQPEHGQTPTEDPLTIRARVRTETDGGPGETDALAPPPHNTSTTSRQSCVLGSDSLA